ncbi:ribosomal protein S6 kinase-like 1 [Sander vitreus]
MCRAVDKTREQRPIWSLTDVQNKAAMAKRDYLVEAAKQIRMALDSEVNEDYEAAFSYYKNGVDLLLNGVQLDPNKDRREAVKRKTTQYLKRAEEIFITHLQDNLGKGSSHLGGYSSLRFRPIRHLSSPVEDLEMCKVVGVTDKVMIVKSMVNKETFVVKSLVKSSWESRDQPTIIPQGVPYMVKLLRYYVSEDAVYLHLEHVKGGRLFSKLHKLRNEKAKEHPECFTSGQQSIKLKASYTSPTISTDYQHNSRGSTGVIPEKLSDESPDADFPTSWDETQQRLESCGTHSYIEETGCLQNTRSAASFYTKLDRLTLNSGPTRTQVDTRIHPPAPSLCLHSSETQEQPALPLSCTRVSHALDVMSVLHKKKGGMGLTECSSEFEVAWKAADPAHNCEQINRYAVTDSHLNSMLGQTPPHTNQTSFIKAGSPNSENNGLSSSPAILHLPLHCQTQIRGRASWDSNGFQQGSVLSGNSVDMVTDSKQDSSSPTTEDRNGMVVIRSTDRAVFSDNTDMRLTSESYWPSSASLCHSIAGKQGTFSGAPIALSGMTYKGETCSSEAREGEAEACELLSPGEKVTSGKGRSYVGWFSSGPTGAPPHKRGEDVDAYLNSEGSEEQGEDQIIEVDGWCHLPRFPVKYSSTTDKAMQTCWGLPEAEVCVWGAQILLALESLHQQGIVCRDLNPRNVLLTSNGKVCLTFFGQWSEVQSEISSKATAQMYCAPEIGGVSRVTEACDWWSLGALLFELLTGMPLWQLHPAGIHSHTQLLIPNHLGAAAASLLTELLQFDAGYRLGSGGGGVSDIKCHPFFSSVSWKALSC